MPDVSPTLTGLVRVLIIGESSAADLALPTSLPIRELIPRIRYALDTGRDDDATADDATDLRPHSLAPLGGAPFSLDATLDTVGVADGEQLLLRQLPEGPAAPPVIENIADAAAIHSERQFPVFEHRMLASSALVAALTVSAGVIALAVHSWLTEHRWWSVATLAATTAAFIITSAVLSRRDNPASAHIALATVVPLWLTLATAIPGDATAPRVFLATTGTVAWALVLSVLATRYLGAYTAIIGSGIPIALAAGARILGHFPHLTLGCGLVAASLIVALSAPTTATRWARFPLPTVPAPDEPVPAPPTLTEIEQLPRKAAASHAHQTGLIAASVLLLTAAAVLMLWLPDHPPLLAWWVIIAMTAITVLRMRIYHAAAPALWSAAAPFLTVLALGASFTATGHLVAAAWTAAAAVALVAVLVLAATITPRPLSVPRRKYLDRFENAMLYTIPPALVWLVGAVSFVRNLGILQ